MATALCPNFYPVKSPRGRIVHAMVECGWAPSSKTVCGRRMRGWIMALAREELNCQECLLGVGWDCRPRKRRKKRARRRR